MKKLVDNIFFNWETKNENKTYENYLIIMNTVVYDLQNNKNKAMWNLFSKAKWRRMQ